MPQTMHILVVTSIVGALTVLNEVGSSDGGRGQREEWDGELHD